MQMKDVAGKLAHWKYFKIPDGFETQDLIVMQRTLLQGFLKSQGIAGKQFLDIDNLKNLSQKQKVRWSSRNILRMFDQIAQRQTWYNQILEEVDAPEGHNKAASRQNFLFEIVDLLHFVFNVSMIWQIEKELRPLYSFDYNYGRQVSGTLDNMSNDLCFLTSELLNCTPWKHWKNWTPANIPKMVAIINRILQLCVQVFGRLGHRPVDLMKMYGVKNKQNLQRQTKRQGYKNG